ncbi:hypothetical protein Dvina_45125 [Dactylosporangium vinaceum]|uniref:Secreted protein n=1 Tax=Dactylosporangium vinaceum TaxID=53362 RepID=A0ABV5MIM9_9ACTN|nr:hypothetical protein [Dactylosporangium vinaceum]UAB95158.1 hypothetical protein Dvina_45125 [Dactylosporangium vinaceum]
MILRLLAATALGLIFVVGMAAVPVNAEDVPDPVSQCERATFVASRHKLTVNADVIRIAQTLCDTHPNDATPSLRHFGETYFPRPGRPCEVEDQYAICVADWIEAVQFFQNRPTACFEQFKRNNKAGKHEVTCPAVDAITPSSTGSQPRSVTSGDDNSDTPWRAIGMVGVIGLVILLAKFNKGDSPYQPS